MYVAFIVISYGLLVSGQIATETVSLVPDHLQTTTQSNVTPAIQCLSINKWNKLEGLCVSRARCDYGTPAIDLTLYSLRRSVRPCASDKVCCPSHSIIPDTPPKDGSNHSQNGDNSDEFDLSDY